MADILTRPRGGYPPDVQRRPRPRRRTLLVGLLVLALVAGLVVTGVWLWRRADRTPLQEALTHAPQDARRVAFTDWTQVRRSVGADLGEDPDRDAVEAMTAKAYDADLSPVSSTEEAAGALQEIYGFGPATAQWELYSQSPKGAAMVLRPPEGTDFDVLAGNLRRAGYDAPAGGGPGGTWDGGIDLVASLDPTLTPALQYVALLPDQGLVVSSDTRSYAASTAKVARGDATPVSDVAGVEDVAGRLGGTVNAMLWTGDFVCEDLSMATAAEEEQQQAEGLVDDVGGVSPLAGFAMGMDAGRTLHVVAHYEDDDRAREDLRARAELVVGETPGRGGGRVADDYELTRSRAVGPDVLLDLRPRSDDGFVLSGLYEGPLVFATC
ncbi:hypothetical protein EDD33_3458 [Nocardioides aurantiacus]|uniref:Uncharacterized protein n=1 Tax=Nocardioides aurantiacus TaxID=86796 RepID=A0A3N2CYF8_9ACTN|nr:hypothetical protein EDD33_3458 [Nocardioides aurantiacus]